LDLPLLVTAAYLVAPPLASANPVILNPSSLMTFCVVAFWAMVVEAGVVALILAFRGVAPLPLFAAYFVVNSAVFLLLFQPVLLTRPSFPVAVLEALVVLIDGMVIRLLVALGPFQGEGYRGVGWVRSLMTSGIGNVLSYLVGYIASHKPWEVEMSLGPWSSTG
jgi:hypothetical protein